MEQTLNEISDSISEGFQFMDTVMQGPSYLLISIARSVRTIEFTHRVKPGSEFIDDALEMLFKFGILISPKALPDEQLYQLKKHFLGTENYAWDHDIYVGLIEQLFTEIYEQLVGCRYSDQEGLLNFNYCRRVSTTTVLLEKSIPFEF